MSYMLNIPVNRRKTFKVTQLGSGTDISLVVKVGERILQQNSDLKLLAVMLPVTDFIVNRDNNHCSAVSLDKVEAVTISLESTIRVWRVKYPGVEFVWVLPPLLTLKMDKDAYIPFTEVFKYLSSILNNSALRLVCFDLYSNNCVESQMDLSSKLIDYLFKLLEERISRVKCREFINLTYQDKLKLKQRHEANSLVTQLKKAKQNQKKGGLYSFSSF